MDKNEPSMTYTAEYFVSAYCSVYTYLIDHKILYVSKEGYTSIVYI